MASVNIAKVKSAQAGGKLIAHMTRYDGREGVTYKNTDIDNTRLAQNWVVGETGESWRQLQTRLADEVKEIDSRIPPRQLKKDRVTLTTVSIPCPAGIEHDEARLHQFFDMAYRTLAEFCSGHCSPGFVHMDEVHEYRDRDGTLKESRPHMHLAMIPYTPERGVHCKSFMSRQRLIDINRELEERCVKELGLHFQTGEAPGRKTVEELKTESIRAEQIIELANLSMIRDEVRQEEQKARKALLAESASRKSAISLESRVAELEQRLDDLESPELDKKALAGRVMLREEEYRALLHRDRDIKALESLPAQLREERRQRYKAEDRVREYRGALDMERMMNSPTQKARAIERAVEPYRHYLEEHGLLEDFDRALRISKSKSLGQTPR